MHGGEAKEGLVWQGGGCPDGRVEAGGVPCCGERGGDGRGGEGRDQLLRVEIDEGGAASRHAYQGELAVATTNNLFDVEFVDVGLRLECGARGGERHR